MRKGAWSSALAAVVVLAAFAPSSAVADPLSIYKHLVVSAGGRAVEWTVNTSYCLDADLPASDSYGTGNECADFLYNPRPTIAFRVHARQVVLTCAAVPVKRVYFALERDGSQGAQVLGSPRSHPVDRARRCWTTTLPHRVHGTRWLAIGMDYGRHGTAPFLVGVRTAGR